ncbi:hypothetical protein [Rhizobium sp. RM]|uniref:hypothetical protein n=1 Tax=Rhizobium sp. RM TaxID=2748079 RepID=UPI00110E5C9D|nr:hypothetical protein [Rhizobium sp. RM]NWJ27720.1 hypothetical protein [Rhizobium sp. RM]TMV21883.1 hypothetical protein BJG94_04145 [Rhizobium sp. Td3]
MTIFHALEIQGRYRSNQLNVVFQNPEAEGEIKGEFNPVDDHSDGSTSSLGVTVFLIDGCKKWTEAHESAKKWSRLRMEENQA